MQNERENEELLKTPELKEFWQSFQRTSEFNPEAFLTLCRDTDEQTVLRILARFHETLEQTSAAIRASLPTDDHETVWKAAHKVAGSAELLGFEYYGQFAREFSMQLRANPDLGSFRTDLAQFLEDTDALKNKISASCATLSNYLV